MSDRFNISLPSGEKKLSEWIRKMMQNNEISPSLIFRDAMIQKKADWDSINSENPATLKKENKRLKKTIGLQSKFISSNEKMQEAWFDFFENQDKEESKQKSNIKIVKEKQLAPELEVHK